MGGFGSTRWGSTSSRDTVESTRSLDINRLNRAGCLRPGYWGGWEWTRDGERTAWIQLRSEGDRLILSYRIRQHGEEWRDVEQPTPVVWRPCRFGGRRPYFLCPGRSCGHHVSKLYGAGTYFLCRHCYRLAYGSQHENHYDRASRRANNIRMRLGGEPGLASQFPERPKGMHRRTYERLHSEVWQAEILAEERLGVILERLKGRESRPRVRVIRRRSSKEFWA
jgi:hypothetical protein